MLTCRGCLQENISCDFDSTSLSSPQASISLLDRAPQQTAHARPTATLSTSAKRGDEVRGLLWLLDETSIDPGGSEEQLVERFLALHKSERSAYDCARSCSHQVTTFSYM